MGRRQCCAEKLEQNGACRLAALTAAKAGSPLLVQTPLPTSAQHPLPFLAELEQLFFNCRAYSAGLHISKIHLLHQWTGLGILEYFWRKFKLSTRTTDVLSQLLGEQQANGQK